MERYDLIVIGSGPAGEKGAAQAAYYGKRVALVEKAPVLGGAGANTDTLPSKTLRETALFLSGFRHRDLKGLDLRGPKPRVSIREFMTREQIVKERQRELIGKNLGRHGVAQFHGQASFVDPYTVAVQGPGGVSHLRGDICLIATGSFPYRPPGFDFSDPQVCDSDEILDLQEMPRRLAVIGGGVIGCEYACIFAILGAEVTLVEKRRQLAGGIDEEIAARLQERMGEMGVKFQLGDSVARVEKCDPDLCIHLEAGGSITADTVLISSGRCGCVQGLGLEQIGVATDERGRIIVNDRYQTSVPHIYAVGDVIGSPALASTSMQQARVAMVHAFDLKYLSGLPNILPYGIYTIPECSMAGQTEQDLRARGTPYVAGKAEYAGNLRGQIIGDTGGFLKLLFHRDSMKLLGVHMIGEQATEVVHVGLTALLLDADVNLFIQACYNYPTLTELYKYASYDALGRRNADAATGGWSSEFLHEIDPKRRPAAAGEKEKRASG